MMETLDIASPGTLPVESISSSKRFVIVTPDLAVISEHDNTPEAVRALARFTLEYPKAEAAIFRRTSSNWQRY